MKKKMKSVVSLLMTMLMLISLIQINVSAIGTESMVIQVSEKTAFAGSTVDVEISLKNNPGVSSIGLDVSYDKDILSLEKIVYNSEMGGNTQSSGLSDNPATLLWVNSSANFSQDATFATLTFKVSANAKEGAVADVKLSYDEDNIYNLEENNVNCETVDGKVTVQTLLAGDINDDGKVNNKDVSRLMQYLAHWEVEVNTLVLDCNGDEKINNKDVSRLMQHLAHWDVELYPKTATVEPDTCEHQLNKVDAVAPTCQKEGHEAYYKCSICGKIFKDFLGTIEAKEEDLVIAKLEHTVVIDPAVAPTNTSEGKTEGSHCSVCGETIVAQQTIPATENFITYHLYADDTYLQETGVDNPNPAYYDSSTGLKLKNIKVDGYIFEGWYDGEGANGELVKTIPAGTTGEVELYAKWTPREYTITFNSPLVPVSSKKYKVNTGATWTNPSLNGYNFIGWCDNDNKLVTNISVGTTGNITLYANWTSKRNQTRPVSHLDDPIILEDSDKGNIMFAYEIGTIENVPLKALSQTYQSVGGMKQTYTTQESVTVTKGEAQNIAKTVSKSSTDSKAWSLSSSWNDVTSVSETYAKEKGWEKEEAEQRSKTSSNTYSVNSSSGGSHTQTTSNGLSGTLSKSNSATSGGSVGTERETGSQFEVNGKVHGEAEVNGEVGLNKVAKVGGKVSGGWEVGASYSNYDKNKKSVNVNYSNTGTSGSSLTGEESSVSSGTSTWNTSSGYSSSSSTSQTNSVRKVLSEVISESKSYGTSYARGGSKSDTQSFTNTSAESDQYSSAITFSEGTTTTETKSIELGGENEGYYRFVLAGIAHVYAVVGYDVSTSSYYTFTYTVMDDDTYTFIDYSKDTASFNDMFGEWETTKAATCTEKGSKVRHCTICDASETAEIEALGHDYDNGVITKAPTCTEKGVKTFTCKHDSSHTYTEEVAELGHDYVGVVTPPTCTEKGYTTYTCSRCKDSYIADYVDAKGHKYDSQVTKEATCTEKGIRTYTCEHNHTHTYTEDIPALGHDYKAVVTPPTCTEKGYTTYTCSRCKDSYVADYVDALGHDYESEVTKEPTCTEKGIRTYTCKHDKTHTYTEEIPALGHNYKASVVEPTCTDDGYTIYTCERCKDTYISDYVDASGHDFESEVTKEPTCTEKGVRTYTCKHDHNHTYTEDIPALGHDYKAVVTPPTCTEKGYTTYTCIHCKDSYVADYVEALGHDYESEVTKEPTCTEIGVRTYTCKHDHTHTYTETISALGHDYIAVVTPPTCMEQGYTTYTCSRCKDSYISDYNTPLGHDYDDGVVTKEPSCTEKGIRTYTCKHDKTHTYTEEIPALGHDYVGVVTPPTCTEKGFTTYTCSHCKDSYVADYVEALGHDYESEVTKEPTCTEKGIRTYTCKHDKTHTYTEEIPSLGHDYKAVVTSPTCTEKGYITYTCSHCGDSYTADETAALGHNYTNTVTKEATYDETGIRTYFCSRCGDTYTEIIAKLDKIDMSKAVISGIKNKIYTGKALTQTIVVKNGQAVLTAKTDYNVAYSNNKNVGTATITITGVGKYTGTITKTFKITKAKNPVSVKCATKTVKLSKIKKTKQTIKPIKVSKAQGKVTYKLTSIPKALKKLVKINTKGAITISKWAKAKKSTYKIKVKITAKGGRNYNKRTITKTVKIVIK